MLKKGFVKIDRKITSWRWYQDNNTFRVFFHLIITANYEDGEFETLTIKRGQRVTSYKSLADETGLSVQNVRTAINHLKSTGEITVNSHAKFSIITIKNYNQYQEDNKLINNQLTSYQQAPNDNERKIKKDKNLYYISFGEFNHIKLTEEQYQNLINEFGEETIKNYIRKMDEWIQLKGKKPYKDYNLAIRNWINRDKENNRNQKSDDFDVEKYKQFINKF